jgi:ABC-type nitrate/sulfonate/bicarbonate transport system ATPase subunit
MSSSGCACAGSLAQRRRIVADNIRLVGSKVRAPSPQSASGGMRQRVQIARSCERSRNPLMDEPFGA